MTGLAIVLSTLTSANSSPVGKGLLPHELVCHEFN
jgi:hypothetical protein